VTGPATVPSAAAAPTPARASGGELSAAARAYLSTESGGAVLLLLATVAALLWVNGPFAGSYEDVWGTTLSLRVGDRELAETLRHWVNDGLMTLFFLLVGLEIARELSVGEYRERRAVVAPAVAAVGGLVLPALVYLSVAGSGTSARGWGIAISTDTAFALGVLALVGPRCPNRLRVFLLALAIVDDIAAVSVIALFYTDRVRLLPLAAAVGLFAVLAALRTARVTDPAPYVVTGVLVWYATLRSGIHPTVAGVAMGLLFAAYAPGEDDLMRSRDLGARFLSGPSAARAREVVRSVTGSVSANDRLTLRLHPLTSFAVVPLFALANAGVRLDGEALRHAATSPVTIGVFLGLVVGKLVGVMSGTWLALRLPFATFAGGARWGQLGGTAAVAGIGFTIALFITELAFDDPLLRQDAKIGIVAGSLVAAAVALGIFRFLASRGGLCRPEDQLLALPPPSQIADPED
jgi:Na+:H+ antiporter, NhaA family